MFDKFVRGARAPWVLRAANVVTRALFTDITRQFERILAQAAVPLEVVHEAPALAGGFFRYIQLRRRDR